MPYYAMVVVVEADNPEWASLAFDQPGLFAFIGPLWEVTPLHYERPVIGRLAIGEPAPVFDTDGCIAQRGGAS